MSGDRDYKGTADIDCPHCGARSTFWLPSWIKSGKKRRFMSLAFKEKDATGSRRRCTTEQTQDEDIPLWTPTADSSLFRANCDHCAPRCVKSPAYWPAVDPRQLDLPAQ